MTKLDETGNMSSSVLELYPMNASVNKFSLINLDQTLSHNIIRMKRLIAFEQCYHLHECDLVELLKT